MTPQELAEMTAASKRERAHAVGLDGWCPCTTCDIDRRTIAKHAPASLALLREWMQTPRRGATDFGDLG